MLAGAEGFGFLQRAPDHEQERHDQAADQERHAPAPDVHLCRRQRGVQDHAQQPGEDHRHLLAGRLPRHVEAFLARLGDLGQVDRYPAQFHAGREPLQQPARQHQQRGGHADRRVAGHQRNQQRAHRHQDQRENQTLAAAVVVDVGAENDGAERTHQEAGAEGGQREHQRGEFVAAREERTGDGGGVEAVHHEIVHFEEVAADDAEHGTGAVLGSRRGGGAGHGCLSVSAGAAGDMLWDRNGRQCAPPGCQCPVNCLSICYQMLSKTCQPGRGVPHHARRKQARTTSPVLGGGRLASTSRPPLRWRMRLTMDMPSPAPLASLRALSSR
ncbi:hypothetical protein D3C86_1409140 [compost metagenome]